MPLNDFNGKGYPLEDDRLKLSGTTEAGNQQYRIWHDSQMILVPKGQSTTKPYLPENVSANVGVFGQIVRGYFNRPLCEFRDTEQYKLFDRFIFETWRPQKDFPTDETYLYNRDLQVNSLRIKYKVELTDSDGDFLGYDENLIRLEYTQTETTSGLEEYVSPVLHFDNFGTVGLRGDYILTTNPTDDQKRQGLTLATGKNVNDNSKYPVFLVVHRALIFNGNSELQTIIKNLDYSIVLKSFTFDFIGGD